VLQEVIVQNFRAKKGTLMADAAEPSLSELLWTVAMARLILGPAMSIQVHLAALHSAPLQD
jgi:FO synthase